MAVRVLIGTCMFKCCIATREQHRHMMDNNVTKTGGHNFAQESLWNIMKRWLYDPSALRIQIYKLDTHDKNNMLLILYCKLPKICIENKITWTTHRDDFVVTFG